MRPLGVGIVGCGNISDIYLRNVPRCSNLALRGVADIAPEVAKDKARRYDTRALTVDALMASSDIDIVVNLTPPDAHSAVSLDAVNSGKHVFSEKPLCTGYLEANQLVSVARDRQMRVGCAPDTFLGGGGRLARQLIDSGAIGRPLSGTVFSLSHGMEHWHPNPEFFFKQGGGPVLDIGPYYVHALVNLLGPVARVRSLTSSGFSTRTVTAAGERHGDVITVETPTTALALLEFEAGAQIVFAMSWDVWKHGHPRMELYGTSGSMRVPDPNFFGGIVETSRGEDWQQHDSSHLAAGAPNWPENAPQSANYRALGIAELADSVLKGTPHRSNGELALHAVEVMQAINAGGAQDAPVSIRSRVERPAPLPEADVASWFE